MIQSNSPDNNLRTMRISVLLLLLMAQLCAFSQSYYARIEDHNGIPIPGAYIEIGQKHAHSGVNGEFSVSDIEEEDSIRVSSIGFEPYLGVVKQLSTVHIIVLNEGNIDLGEVIVTAETDPLEVISKVDVQTKPVNSSQDILRKVPGLFIGQHAGGGKAEQIFLRGFDIDHGTDVNITFDGMPVNMVSHAHGQGYADLHFIIPETVKSIAYGKGPYNSEKGNFATAGHVAFQSEEKLRESRIQLERGNFNSSRALAMIDLSTRKNTSAYVAAEYIQTDGPFESSQNFDRINVFGKYTKYLNEDKDKISLSASHFQSEWDASGQIPVRSVMSGDITRFGAIDDTEGGNTSRSNASLTYAKSIDKNTYLKTAAYYSHYTFDLFSNFTFFLNDSINGDQIRQVEDRMLFGGNSELVHNHQIGSIEADYKVGVGLRQDRTNDSELSRTRNRTEVLEYVQLGDIHETNTFLYADGKFSINKWMINPAIRIDQFRFQYTNELDSLYNPEAINKAVLSPKLNIVFNPSKRTQFYLKTGIGYHSNDTRVIIQETGNDILPRAYGTDLGGLFKIGNKFIVQSAFWALLSEQEFVYVGDAGIVEAGGVSRRLGVDLTMRYNITPWLTFDIDANYAYARIVDEEKGSDYIPLAPSFTSTSALNFKHETGFYGSLQSRYLADRPANEDNSITAEGYFIIDANAGYRWRSVDLGFGVQNLLNSEWNETQFATETRLQNELESVEEIHFTPGTPFFARATLKYFF